MRTQDRPVGERGRDDVPVCIQNIRDHVLAPTHHSIVIAPTPALRNLVHQTCLHGCAALGSAPEHNKPFPSLVVCGIKLRPSIEPRSHFPNDEVGIGVPMSSDGSVHNATELKYRADGTADMSCRNKMVRADRSTEKSQPLTLQLPAAIRQRTSRGCCIATWITRFKKNDRARCGRKSREQQN